MNQTIQERIRSLRPIDDILMRCLFRDNIPLTQFVLRILTGIQDLNVISVKTQADLKQITAARSLYLDIYARDSKNRLYNLEIQRSDTGELPQRARYHASCLDVENLKKGQSFSDLPEVYILFVTEQDIFGLSAPVYCFDRIDPIYNQILHDGSHILYANASYQEENEIGHLMHDFLCSDPDSMYNQVFADSARPYKETIKGETEMGNMIEELLEEGRIEGRNEGKTLVFDLIRKLNESGRSDDILRITTDAAFREELIKEFGL